MMYVNLCAAQSSSPTVHFERVLAAWKVAKMIFRTFARSVQITFAISNKKKTNLDLK